MNKINSAKFLETINNRSIINQYKLLPGCSSNDLDRNIAEYRLIQLSFSLELKFKNSKFSKTWHSQK